MTVTGPEVRRRKAWAPEADDERAYLARLLARRCWLSAGRDDDAIAAVRRHRAELGETFGRLGWALVVQRDFVRLRKSPPPRRTEFAADGPKPLTAAWYYCLVAGAETLPPRVAMSSLVSAARAAAAEAGVPSTGLIDERRAIIEALKMLDQRGVIEEVDGDVSTYLHVEEAHVLLAIHHTRLLEVVANFPPLDPIENPSGWLNAAERESDAARRMRRRLVDDTLIHADDLDEDESDWLRRRVRGDDGQPLAAAFGLRLERRSEGAAFVVPDGVWRHPHELGPFPFPVPGTVGQATLLTIDNILAAGRPHPERLGWRGLDYEDVLARLGELSLRFSTGKGGWAAEYATDLTHLADEIARLLTGLALLRLDDATWWLSPAAARWKPPATHGRRTPTTRETADEPHGGLA